MRLYAHRRLDAAGEQTEHPRPPPRPLPGPGRGRRPPPRNRRRARLVRPARHRLPQSRSRPRMVTTTEATPTQLCRIVAALAPCGFTGGSGLRLPAADGIGWIDSALAASDHTTPGREDCSFGIAGAWPSGRSISRRMATLGQEGLSIAREHERRPAARALPRRRRSGSRARQRDPAPCGRRRSAPPDGLVTPIFLAGRAGRRGPVLSLPRPEHGPCLRRGGPRPRPSIEQSDWPLASLEPALGWLAHLEGRPLEAIAVAGRGMDGPTIRVRAVALALLGVEIAARSGLRRRRRTRRRAGRRRPPRGAEPTHGHCDGMCYVLQTRALVAAASGDLEAAVDFAESALSRALHTRRPAPTRSAIAALIHLAAGELDSCPFPRRPADRAQRREELVFSAPQGVSCSMPA